MRNAYLVLFVVALIGAACSPQPSAPPTPGVTQPVAINTSIAAPPTAAVTPTAQPVTGSQIPPGKYLFVEFSVQAERDSGCDRAYQDHPNYTYDETGLHLPPGLVKSPADLNAIKGFFGRAQTLTGPAGFGTNSALNVIPAIPYLDKVQPNGPFAQAPDARIVGAGSRGQITVEIAGQTVTLQPGESWQDQSESGDVFGCHAITTRTFTNYGLLDKSQLK